MPRSHCYTPVNRARNWSTWHLILDQFHHLPLLGQRFKINKKTMAKLIIKWKYLETREASLVSLIAIFVVSRNAHSSSSFLWRSIVWQDKRKTVTQETRASSINQSINKSGFPGWALANIHYKQIEFSMVFSQKLQNSEKNLLHKNLKNIASFTILLCWWEFWRVISINLKYTHIKINESERFSRRQRGQVCF